MKKTYTVLGALLLLALACAAAWWWLREDVRAVQYRMGKIERGSLQATVAASGTVNPVSQVSVGTQVSGQIRDLYVDFNSEVKAGQLLARIDPETFEYRLRSAQADVDAANAAVLTAQANLAAAQSQVSRTQVDLDEAQRDHARKQSLVEKQFIAQSEADKARALVNTATEALKAARAQVNVAQAQVKSAQANVAQRQAARAQAAVDLARTRITSPVTGIVIKRSVERGQTVASSLQAPELFVIAQNLSDMQVEASIDESDVGRLRVGQKASFTVDAFPGQTFEGEVRQVRKAALNVSNVVTYIAVVGFSNANSRLLPGMTANVRVVTEQRENVLKIPNAALRVRIAGVEPEAEPGAATTAAPSSAGAGTPSAGGHSEFRDRLVRELKLNAEQTQQVDAIYESVRTQFAQLREMPEEERAKARDKIMAQVRARVGDVLSPEQRTQYAALLAQGASRTLTRGRVYVLDANARPKALAVRLGISDGSNTELLPGPNGVLPSALAAGMEVITGLQTGSSALAVPSAANGGAAATSARPGAGLRSPF